ncbi:MAG: hypothetical protein Q8R37_02480, partial [Nanoarchaeota archaeon]|nr:hypothetical protein [Nanoarchaeota archaeon]
GSGLRRIGAQGGYYLLRPEVLFTTFAPITDIYINNSDTTDEQLEIVNNTLFTIPYYFYHGESAAPDKEFMKAELTKYVEDNLPTCLDDFTLFKEQGLIITEKPYTINIDFPSGRVQLELEYPLTISDAQGSSVQQLDNFHVDYGLDFKRVLDVITQAFQRQENAGETIIAADLAILAKKYDFRYEIDYQDADTVLYFFYFKQDKITDYVFAYAAQYDWSNTVIFDDPYLNSEPIDYEI